MNYKRKYLSVVILILVNLFPIFGVIYLGWNIFEIVILYVIETFIIGIINAFKMLLAKGQLKIVMIPFFLLHYNFFIAVQTFFVVILLGSERGTSFLSGGAMEDFVSILGKKDILLSIACLSFSHLFSFYNNFYKKEIYKEKEVGYFFAAPYKRIFVQQFVVIFGAWIGLLFNTPMVYLILLVFFKILIDLRSHMKMNAIGKEK